MHKLKNILLIITILGLQFFSFGIINTQASNSICFDYGYSCGGGGYRGYDQWGFYTAGSPGVGGNHNCTSYAAYRASTNGSRRPSGNLGHAGQWADNARKFGFKVDNSPAVGAIAQFVYGVYGHVAYVESINSDGSLTLSQDNYDVRGNMREGWTEITKVYRNSGWPNNFIHFSDITQPINESSNNLAFIKTKNTDSGTVELHVATQLSGYKSGLSTPTRIKAADAVNGNFEVLSNGDLAFIKTKNTDSGTVELHVATQLSGYKSGLSTPTRIKAADAANGNFEVLSNGDLAFIKTKNTDSGTVELHVATQLSGYKSGLSTPTRIKAADAVNGNFEVY
jgi:surface antigen